MQNINSELKTIELFYVGNLGFSNNNEKGVTYTHSD